MEYEGRCRRTLDGAVGRCNELQQSLHTELAGSFAIISSYISVALSNLKLIKVLHQSPGHLGLFFSVNIYQSRKFQ